MGRIGKLRQGQEGRAVRGIHWWRKHWVIHSLGYSSHGVSGSSIDADPEPNPASPHCTHLALSTQLYQTSSEIRIVMIIYIYFFLYEQCSLLWYWRYYVSDIQNGCIKGAGFPKKNPYSAQTQQVNWYRYMVPLCSLAS
jgi:hypothetical protein